MFPNSDDIFHMADFELETRCISPSAEGVAEAAHWLRNGAIVGIPTETVYGLAGHLFREEALAKVFAAKERPTFDPLIVHVAWRVGPDGRQQTPTCADLVADHLVNPERMTGNMTRTAGALIERFWPGPLTVVLPKHTSVPDLATSGLDTVAIRMPAHPVAQAILRATDAPLVAPSANRFGRISPTTAADVMDELAGRIPLVVDGGECDVGIESTVVQINADGVHLLRPGGIPAERIEEVLRELGAPPLTRPAPGAPPPSGPQASPGLLERHYAPTTPLLLLAEGWPSAQAAAPHPIPHPNEVSAQGIGERVARGIGEGVGLLLASPPSSPMAPGDDTPWGRVAACVYLSETGDPAEGARNLFRGLRALDQDPLVTLIVAEPWPGGASGLGWAINDRLRRGAAGSRPE
jgi:L-threonylcarbamoyladenylate synthase